MNNNDENPENIEELSNEKPNTSKSRMIQIPVQHFPAMSRNTPSEDLNMDNNFSERVPHFYSDRFESDSPFGMNYFKSCLVFIFFCFLFEFLFGKARHLCSIKITDTISSIKTHLIDAFLLLDWPIEMTFSIMLTWLTTRPNRFLDTTVQKEAVYLTG